MSHTTLFRPSAPREAYGLYAPGLSYGLRGAEHSFEQSASPLADYVLDELPADLAAIRAGEYSYDEPNGLHDKHGAILEHYAEVIANNNDPEVAAATQLDLSFMLGSYLPLGKDAMDHLPPKLGELLQLQADRWGLPPNMDYELIIDVNARETARTGRTRTYLQGEAGQTERDFYLGHAEAELFAKAAAFSVEDLLGDPTHANATQILEDAARHVDVFVKFMQAYIRMDRDHFNTFRPYLADYPHGPRNASGAFMPSVQLLELSLRPPTEQHGVFLDNGLAYMPRWGRPQVADARKRSEGGGNVLDMFRNGELELDNAGLAAYVNLLEGLINFRLAHGAATYKQIPGAFEEETRGPRPISRAALKAYGELSILGAGEAGTAGFNVRDILAGTVSRLLTTLDELDAHRASKR